MEYRYLELVLFFFFYAFLGWVIEVSVMAILRGKFYNRGFLNLPFRFSYGIILDILLVLFRTMHGQYLLQFVATLVVTGAVEYLSGTLTKNTLRRSLWEYDRKNIFGGDKKGWLYSVGEAVCIMLVLHMIHPMIFFCVKMTPILVLRIIMWFLVACTILDFVAILYAIHCQRKGKWNKDRISDEMQKNKVSLGKLIYDRVWNRLHKAYPNMEPGEEETSYVFAKGICFDKLFWVFISCALIGDLVETVYIGLTVHKWGSRSSVIYGPFSVVWGFGAVIMSIIFQKLAEKEDRYTFLAGFFLGGAYEYFCSVFTEFVFGTKFWDYTDMPFNIGGRTNLLFCLFWGIAALVWVKICYPIISRMIEKIPPLTGKIFTWILMILMICDLFLSAAAMIRYNQRLEDSTQINDFAEFLDYHYPDEVIERVWPNMRIPVGHDDQGKPIYKKITD